MFVLGHNARLSGPDRQRLCVVDRLLHRDQFLKSTDLSVHTRDHLEPSPSNSTAAHPKRSTGKPRPSACMNYSRPDQTDRT
ncbi:hypothetical protein [Streptomyces sp. NPDC058092]|uniref:hypothetical protein n=1 Tax=Streptomyces sp. NPDC058092 TaxID=3346336 RepID=UPI0036F0B83B